MVTAVLGLRQRRNTKQEEHCGELYDCNGRGTITLRGQKIVIDCVRSRKAPNADAEVGHRATTVCDLANICRELGRKLQWDPKVEKFVGDDEANALLSRPRRKGYELPGVS